MLWGALSLFLAAHAGAEKGSVGSTGANFLKLAVGPRAIALGETFTGLADDISAIAYNPAGLGLLSRQELTAMHSEFGEGVRQEWFGYAYPSRWGTFALSVNALHTTPFPVFDAADVPSTEVTAQDASYGLTYARAFGRWSVGLTGKILRSRLVDERAHGASFDAGLLWDVWDGFRVGLAAFNGGPEFSHPNTGEELPLEGRVGFSYRLFRVDERQGREQELTFLMDAHAARDRDTFPSMGVEYIRHGVLALRAGWRGGKDNASGLSLGAGVLVNHYRKGRVPEISFDYAFIDEGDLDQSHRASVTLKFGAVRWANDLEVYQAQQPEKPKAVVKPKTLKEKVWPGTPAPKKEKPEPQSEDVMWVNP
jgi:hypothetical protein